MKPCANGCGRPRRKHHAYCSACQLAYQRAWRAATTISRIQKRKKRVRSATSRAIRNGGLEPQPCKCGVLRSFTEAHHLDYSKPLEVEWLCRPCHHALHKAEETHVGRTYRKRLKYRRSRKGSQRASQEVAEASV